MGVDLRVGREYALRQEIAGDARVLELLRREGIALRELRHQSIVAVRDVVIDGDRARLLMEKVDGVPLPAYLAERGGSLPPAEAVTIVTQVAAALAYAHARGVVHNGLRPETVLLVTRKRGVEVKLTDFGLAALLVEAHAGKVTASADVYALGALFATLVRGAAVPDAVHRLMSACLDRDPLRRPAARTIAAELSRTAPSAPKGRLWKIALAGSLSVAASVTVGLTITLHTSAQPKSSATMVMPTSRVAATAEVNLQVTFAAHLAGDAGTLYIAIRDGVAIAYYCDGKKIEAWFRGTAKGGTLKLTGDNGNRISGTADAMLARGTVTVGDVQVKFTLTPAGPGAGLFKSLTKVNGARIKGGWIVLADGTQVGVLDVDGRPQPAPLLDPATGIAVIQGQSVDTTAVNPATGEGF